MFTFDVTAFKVFHHDDYDDVVTADSYDVLRVYDKIKPGDRLLVVVAGNGKVFKVTKQ